MRHPVPSSAHVLALLIGALLLATPIAPAQSFAMTAPPADAARATSGNVTAIYWNGPGVPLANGESGNVNVVLNATNGTTLGRIHVNFSSTSLVFTNASWTLTPANPNASSYEFSLPFHVATNESGNVSYAMHIDVHGADANATVATFDVEGLVEVRTIEVPAPAPLVPTSWLIGGGIVLLIAIAIGAYSARQRSVQRRMRGRARSQALREAELERQVVKRPEEVQRVKEEIREQEQVRVQRRESQILEAKKADVLKNMELLKKRHEMGGLTKLQYDTMRAKRQADLDRIEAEIAEFERTG